MSETIPQNAGWAFNQGGIGMWNAGLTTDPPVPTGGVIFYTKQVSGTSQFFCITPDGTITQLTPASAGSAQRGYYGDGSDGTVTFDGSTGVVGTSRVGSVYTLTRDVFFSSATVNSGISVVTNGWRFFCSGTLTITSTGSIGNDGQPGITSLSGAGGNPGGHNTIGGTGTGGGAGGPGGAGNGLTGGQISPGGFGGNGGAGGAGSSHSGGIGGTVSQGTIAFPRMVPEAILGAVTTANAGTLAMTMVAGGGGGGSGAASDGGGTPGTGGGGGGVVVVSTAALTGSGNITAKGGSGGNGSSPSGAGGGAGGGVIILVYGSKTGWTGSLLVTGGAAGTGGFAAAVAGSAGQTFQIAG